MFSKPKIITDREKISELFGRYVENIFPSKEKAVEMLSSGRQLSFYLGIDPTGPDIHLGHMTNLLLMKKLRLLGHRIILLIGGFTAMIGDPSGKELNRKALSEQEVKKNAETYLNQAYKILEKGSFDIKNNANWLKSLSFADILSLSMRFTVQQMIVRDMFQERIKNEKPIFLNEFLYPLAQGYDSVAMEVDGEIGGNDQTFNMLVGRDLVKEMLNKEKLVLTTKLLVNPATNKKIMNKSEGRYISLNDSPKDVFGKTMSLPDYAILPIFEDCTEVSEEKIKAIRENLAQGANPKEAKEELGLALVKMMYGEKEAERAKEEFKRVFSENQLPEQMPELKIVEGDKNIVEAIFESGLAESKSEIKRLLDQGAVSVNGETIKEWEIKIKAGYVKKIGSRKFLKITKD